MELKKFWRGFEDRYRTVIQALPPGVFLRRLLISVAVVLILLLVWFFVALFNSTQGEVAGALGSLIGGIIGGAAAVSAVFILIWQEKDEEKRKVGDAVKIEVTTLAKYVIGAVSICQDIASGLTKVPREQAGYIVKNFAEDPVIYRAVADRIGLLPHPQATTEFYMRIAEAKVMVQMLQNKSIPQGIMFTSPAPDFVTPEFAGTVADSLLTALQLARPIVANQSEAEHLRVWVEKVVVGQIDECLALAKVSFPNAEAFIDQPPEA